jgi:hypothetical protein
MEPRGRERHRRAAHLGKRAGANESNALQNLSKNPRQDLCSELKEAPAGWFEIGQVVNRFDDSPAPHLTIQRFNDLR